MDSNGHYELSDLLNELPTPVTNDLDSVMAFVWSLLANDMENAQSTVDKVDKSRSIDEAAGRWLDKLGADWGVNRNGFDDNFYRFLIKTRQLARQTDGTYNSLIHLIADSLGAKYSEINVEPVKDESQAIQVTNIPAEYIDSQRKEAMVLSRIRGSVVAGVRVARVQFQKVARTKLYYGMATRKTQVIQSKMTVPQEEEA
ncbi:hypothetical protein [Levilactobacillus namurensis]|uniref:hypothetical protein n=1 Tax=Levilactobacillus namurensis TaxID=380393 RepID=UPI0026EE3C52|nr:hypothetical protein [Levilactobacillus namurensis]